MPRISLIIRCYNEEAHIGRLLSGIMAQSEKHFEILIVDSGSTDATVSIASQYPVTVLNIPKSEFSFGRSLNIGCEAASGEILVFASAHVYPIFSNWLEKLCEPFEDERIACVYGRQCGDKNTKFSEQQVFARWFPAASDYNQDHPFCNNANAAVRKSVWKQLRYDETLTGLEDLAWAKQAISQGQRIAYQADALVVHVHAETWKQVLNRYRREAIAMKALFPHERFSFLNFLQMFIKNSSSDAIQALKLGVFGESILSILSFRLMQFWGTFRGYSQQGAVGKKLREKFYYPNDSESIPEAQPDNHGNTQLIDYSKHSSTRHE